MSDLFLMSIVLPAVARSGRLWYPGGPGRSLGDVHLHSGGSLSGVLFAAAVLMIENHANC